MPDANIPASTVDLSFIRPSVMTANQRTAYAAQLMADAPGALLRQGFHISLGFLTTNEVLGVRRNGWDADIRRY